jgi:LuxR family maltose regulon positive regulatory protein
MSIPLLTTKLFLPPARPNLVPRPRLIEVLNAGLKRPLTLISAPAGYGKTTLLSDWRAGLGSGYPLAWLSLDSEDNDLARFLSYVSASLETLHPKLTQNLTPQLHLPQLPSVEVLITVLINGVNAFPQDFALILDDYHLITEAAIHKALVYLLNHPPLKMHLVLITRSDPPLPLSRLRARGQMVELRADDLRFTIEETTAFLNTVMDLNLSAENISALDQRTEGWIVGLQMAALSTRGKTDATAFIKAFTGSHRYILDYFAGEILEQQPESVKTFLLKTSILDRFTSSLCDAVLGGLNNSTQILMELDQKNLFIIPLDDERQWYRYHHLFAELLHTQLSKFHPETIPGLHRKAAGWFEYHGLMEEAVRHAILAQDYELTTRLVDQVRDRLWGRGDTLTLLNWFKTIPEELIRSQPLNCLAYASAFTLTGQFESAEQWFQCVDDHIRRANISHELNTAQSSAVNPSPFTPWMLYGVDSMRSMIARLRGDTAGAIDLSQRALEQIPKDDLRAYGRALLYHGLAHYYAGDFAKAHRVLIEAIQTNQASGHIAAYLCASHHLARLYIMQGHLHDAEEIYQRATEFVAEQQQEVFVGIDKIGIGDLYLEWNEIETASSYIKEGMVLAELGGDIHFLRDGYITHARLAQAQGDWNSALAIIQKAEQVARRSPTSTDIAYMQAWRARLQLAQGNLATAELWAEIKKPENLDPMVFQHEFELLTLARIWLAQGKTDQTASLLERIRIAAEAGGRHGRVLEIQMLQALTDQADGRETQAVEKLTRVLLQAEAEGYMRLFLDEGAPMAKLLYKVSARTTTSLRNYAERLLSAFYHEQAEKPAPLTKASRDDPLIEPLTKRELEVLRLVAVGKANLEIAADLVLAVGTVKKHLNTIFGKLNVNSRTLAIARARELGLL